MVRAYINCALHLKGVCAMETNWDRIFDVLILVTIVSMMVERALALFFESRLLIDKVSGKGNKEIICGLIGIAVCIHWKIDAMYVLAKAREATTPGMILTGLVVAGGSKASVKLFQDVMGIKSGAKVDRDAAKAAARAGGG